MTNPWFCSQISPYLGEISPPREAAWGKWEEELHKAPGSALVLLLDRGNL